MNKRVSVIFATSMLLSAVPVKPISHHTAAVLTAISAPLYYLGLKKGLVSVQQGPEDEVATFQVAHDFPVKPASALGATGLTAGTYWFFYKFTPYGRYNRAYKILDKVKDAYPRVFGDVQSTNIEQILHDLGAFKATDSNSRNFVYLNAIQELDKATTKLKKAESLLLAAKKDIYPEAFEFCKLGAQKLYAKAYAHFKKTQEVKFGDPENHMALEAKIDELLGQVRASLNQASAIYGKIELYGAKEFKEQLKDYEELRGLRSQNMRLAVVNFAIPVATIAGSLAVTAIGTGIALKAGLARRF